MVREHYRKEQQRTEKLEDARTNGIREKEVENDEEKVFMVVQMMTTAIVGLSKNTCLNEQPNICRTSFLEQSSKTSRSELTVVGNYTSVHVNHLYF